MFTTIVAMLTFTSATFAWFTSNARVNTTRLTASAVSEAATLMISGSPDGDFSTSTPAPIAKLSDEELLLPVSTYDLSKFFDMKGENPVLVQNEKNYFHGRVYLMAQSENPLQSLEIWLDGTNAVVTNATGDILNASRLGLKIEDGPARIFYLSDEHNAAEKQIYNTYLGGELQNSDSIVVDSVSSVAPDPSVALSRCSISRDGNTVVRGEEPLGHIELNRVYAVDVYFWLEGCDPDCSDYISFENLDLTLHFYGVVEEGTE